MRNAKVLTVLAVVAVLTSWLSVPLYGGEPTMSQDELVAKHLDALGTKEARAAAKTRAVQGTAVYKILVGGSGTVEGKTGLVSDGRKVRFMMKFSTDYKGETIVCNGEKVQIAFSNTNQSLSPLAGFLTSYDFAVKDGILGGVLSTGWALSDLAERNAKLVNEGLKKVDGRQLYQVRYEPQKHSDVVIRLFFEPDTFRHVKTLYSLSVVNNVGTTITNSVDLQPERSSLEERFSDFKTVDGLTLPTQWNLQFTRERANGSTSISEWDLSEGQLANNVGLDPKNFELK